MSADAIAALKAQLASQQKQIEQLRQTLEMQQRLLERTLSASGPLTNPETPVAASASGSNVVNSPFAKLGDVASRSRYDSGRSLLFRRHFFAEARRGGDHHFALVFRDRRRRDLPLRLCRPH